VPEKPPSKQNPADREVFRDKMFVALAAAVTLAFAIVVAPVGAAVFWAVVLALLFTPAYRWLTARLNGRSNVAAALTVLAALAIVIVPAVLIGAMVVEEASGLGSRVKSGELAPDRLVERVVAALPPWAMDILAGLGFRDVASMQKQLAAGILSAANVVGTHAVDVGKNAAGFAIGLLVMIYVLFFLLRDGRELYARLRSAVPLRQDIQQALFPKLAGAVRAVIKGSLTVAVVQGILGGLVFWMLGFDSPALWGAVMGFLALIPVLGTAFVWLPAAIYLLATGDVTRGIVLLAVGTLVISMIDNVLGPILVGKDTRMPDWIVLVSVLGGLSVFGMTGFVAGPAIAALFLAVWGVVVASRQSGGT
jgi:predicted PurR-regulated permease PerM